MKRALVAFALLLISVGCRSWREEQLAYHKLDPVLHQMDVTRAVLSARVIDLKNNHQLYASDPDRSVMPASNLKLPTTATGLDVFGPDYKFKTYLASDGDNLWIIGTGDPATGDAKVEAKYHRTPTSILHDWTAALKKAHITHVNGNLYYYDGAFELTQISPYWSRGYLQEWYAAPVSGLNFNDNCIDVTVEPADNGKPATYTIVPPLSHIKIVNNTVSGGEQNNPEISRDNDSNTFTITGHVTKKTELRPRAVVDPGYLFADALETEMNRRGITVDGRILRAPAPLGGMEVPSSAKLIAVHETKFTDIVYRILANSQNLFAECCDKAMGKKVFDLKGDHGPGTWKKGSEAAHIFLRSWKVDDKPLVMADGSGLARADRVTARLITDLLAVMHRHPYATTFRESMAQPGNGTLGKRLMELQGRVWAKTGYIGGVRSLSGYVHTKADHWIAFSFIYNQIPGDVTPFEQMQDEAVRDIYQNF